MEQFWGAFKWVGLWFGKIVQFDFLFRFWPWIAILSGHSLEHCSIGCSICAFLYFLKFILVCG